MIMSKYNKIADDAVKAAAAAVREGENVDKSVVQTGNGMVGNLKEFADDFNASIQKNMPDAGARVTATEWKKENNKAIGKLSISYGGMTDDFPIEFEFGSPEVKVKGVTLKVGDNPMSYIAAQFSRILRS
jgi:hypothetical protein